MALVQSLCVFNMYILVPAYMGTNDSNAGDIHVHNIITATTRLVILMGYFNGFTIA